MEEKNGDNGERRENDRLKIQQNISYSRRPLSNHTSDNYQVSLHMYLFIPIKTFKYRSIKILDVVYQYQ